ncbi:uncharacterized protein LOC135351641 isoform X2 [Halichondria panicea]|uniref:uncharacterized protein LOC135351641 isoform X2 n=1 Tax=Halichondria panicea TaxID=6063 RepID=UPI00312B86AC
MITVIIANSIVTKWVNGTTCSMKCQTVVELPVSRGETSCYFLTIKARNTKGDSFSVFHDYLLSEDLMLCDTPESTANGRLINYDNSSSNSLRLGTNVSYQCNDGLIPNEEKISTCSNVLGEAKWIPDPSQFVCRKREDSVKEISLTINQVAVICTTVTFIVAMVSGCAGGALLTYWVMRKKTVFSPAAEGQINVGPTVPADPIYEEVSPKEKIEMNTNQAYGPCSVNL